MPDFLPRQRWPLGSCQTGTDDLPTRFGPNVRRWGSGGSQTHPWREMDPTFRFRASGATSHRPRGEAASHRSRLPLRRDPPSGRDLDDGTVSQLLEELAGEMNRPSDRKRRISGYGDREAPDFLVTRPDTRVR